MAFDVKKFTPFDWAVGATGLLLFIDMFLPWDSFSGPSSAFTNFPSAHGWHFVGAWLPMFLILAAAVWFVLGSGGITLPQLPVSRLVSSVGVTGVGALIILIRVFTLPSASSGPYSYGAAWGAYVGLIIALAQTGLLVYLFVKSGEKLPWAAGATSTGGNAQDAPSAPTATAAPYTPPAPPAEPFAPPAPPGPPPAV